VKAEVIPRISAEVCSLVLAIFPFTLKSFIINGVSAVAK
jgi:hypothetical protein